MKKYLVSKDVVDAFLDGSWGSLSEFQADDSWGSNEIVELPPGSRVLTREQVETARDLVDSLYMVPSFELVLDELFGEVE